MKGGFAMKPALQQLCTSGFVAVLLGSAHTTVHASIKPSKDGEQIRLTDYKPPSLHTNQGGRNYTGGSILITPSLNIWKPLFITEPLLDMYHPMSLASLLTGMSNDGTQAFTKPAHRIHTRDMDPIGFDVIEFASDAILPAPAPGAVPAPSALTVLLLAGLGAGRRRRRTS
jgi:hypothetical protein